MSSRGFIDSLLKVEKYFVSYATDIALVQLRTKSYNSLQAIALSAGVSLKAKLRTRGGKERLLGLSLTTAGHSQRQEWLALIAQLNVGIERVKQELEVVAAADHRVQLVRTHPGIGLLTGLGLVQCLSPVSRFANSRKVAAYVGLEPVNPASTLRPRNKPSNFFCRSCARIFAKGNRQPHYRKRL